MTAGSPFDQAFDELESSVQYWPIYMCLSDSHLIAAYYYWQG